MVKPLYGSIPNNKCRRNEENRKSPLERHSNNDCRQDPWMNTVISRWNFKEKQDICVSSKHLPQILINFCGGFNICPQILWSSSLQEVEFNSPPKQSMEWEKNSKFEVEKIGGIKHYLHQVIKAKVTSGDPRWYHVPLI